MTPVQKAIISALVAFACFIFTAISGAAIIWLNQASPPAAVADAAIQPALATSPVVTATPLPSATFTATPTETPPPTAVATQVVAAPGRPTSTPTPLNCTSNVINFGASGVLSDAQVQQFIEQSIPANHLDHCRRIEYVHKLAAVHGTAITGNFIPIDRKIFVYAFSLQDQDPVDLLETLVHEIGHNVFFNLWRQDFKFEQRWIQVHRNGGGFVSDYARASYMEDFAETYRVYILAPAGLQQVSQVKYQFMVDEVFAGREYQP